MSVGLSQKISPKASANPRLPWPPPQRPQRIPVCASLLATYSIVVGVEAWDKADPRAVASFRCQRHAKGRAFSDTLLLQRVPLAALTEQAATAHFARLVAWLRDRAQTDAIREEAKL